MTPWYLYLIRTADNKLYTGITTDVERHYLQ
ncbi:GIY-YIG nuclease family protein, partial [Escherichia sp. HC-TM1]